MTVRQNLGELLADELAVAYKGAAENVAQQEIDNAAKQARTR